MKSGMDQQKQHAANPAVVCALCLLQADICQLGMDQRKVNMLAREYADDCKPKRRKPIVLSHPMMPGLLQVMLPPGPRVVASRLWLWWFFPAFVTSMQQVARLVRHHGHGGI